MYLNKESLTSVMLRKTERLISSSISAEALQEFEKSLNNRVVVGMTFCRKRLSDIILITKYTKKLRSILRATIRMKKNGVRRFPCFDGVGQGINDKVSSHRLADRVRYYHSGEEINDDAEVYKSGRGFYVGDITTPNKVGSRNIKLLFELVFQIHI